MNSRFLDFIFPLHLYKFGFRTLTICLDLHIPAPSLVCGGAVDTWEVDTCTEVGWWDDWFLTEEEV